MGKKGGWFSAVRKALSPSYDSKEKKDKRPAKSTSKRSWFGKQKSVDIDSPQDESAFATPALRSPPPEHEDEPELKTPMTEPSPSQDTKPRNEPSQDIKPENEPSQDTKPENETSQDTKPKNEPSQDTKAEKEPSKPTKPEKGPSKRTRPEKEPSKPTKPENEPSKPTKTKSESPRHAYSVAARAAEAAAAVARRFLGKSKEEVAAIKIQTAFRRFLGRKALRALRGCRRLKALVKGQSVKRQATTTLRCMQTLARVQSQVRARRIRMTEENQALQRQLMQKHEKELNNLRSSLGRDWENSRRSKEELDTSIQHKQEAAARRERALAYAQTHQQMWRNSSKSSNPTFMDPNNPHWGWSWLERWMAARPWESLTMVQPEPPPSPSPVKTITRCSSVGDMSKRLPTSPSTSSPKATSSPRSGRNPGLSSPRVADDVAQRNRRHSIASPSMREESSSASVRGSASSPRSTKTRSMIPSPSRSPRLSPLGSGKKVGSEKKTVAGPVKKRLSLSGTAASGSARRLSGPPRMGLGPGSR